MDKKKSVYCLILFFCILLFSCRDDMQIMLAEYENLSFSPEENSNPRGMYILNEGNMGSNRATIDYVDFRSATYIRDLYAERNPNVVMELGDVGNDIQLYGNKLYAVLNCSHKVEVMDAYTCERIAQIDISNGRFIRFHEGNAYITSYIGPVGMNSGAEYGAVFRVDTTNFEITGEVTVGYQPDELEIVGNYIYVANSGGYRSPDYDHTVSVIDIGTFKQVAKIPVGVNLQRIRKDKYNKLWITSRGNYKDIPPKIYVLEPGNNHPQQMVVSDSLDIPCSNWCLSGDSIYFFGAKEEKPIFGIIDINNRQLVSEQLITDGTESEFQNLSGILKNPENGDLFISDAKNYVSSGFLFCYDKEGKQKWKVKTGHIPAHLTLFYQTETN